MTRHGLVEAQLAAIKESEGLADVRIVLYASSNASFNGTLFFLRHIPSYVSF